jgi:hypothetical protein
MLLSFALSYGIILYFTLICKYRCDSILKWDKSYAAMFKGFIETIMIFQFSFL